MPSQQGDRSASPGVRYSYLAWGALVLLGLIYGYNYIVMKAALQYAHPAVFAALRIGITGVLLLLLLVVLRRPLRPPNWRVTVLVGVFGTAGFTGLTMWALSAGAEAGKTSVLVYTLPIWLLILSSVFLHEKVRRYQWAYAGVALAGLILVIAPWDMQGTVAGNLLAVGAGVSTAISSVLAKTLCRDRTVDLLSLNAWQMLFSSVPLIIIAVFTAESGPEWTGWFVVTLIYNIVLASALAMFLWLFILRNMHTGTAGLGRLIAPVVGVAAGVIQLGERPRAVEIGGMALILLGVSALAVHQLLSERRAARLRAMGAAPETESEMVPETARAFRSKTD